MRKPNELARKVMSKAADYHATIAEMYETMADDARRFAIALREGDADYLLDDSRISFDKLEEAKKNALDHLKMLHTADPEWWAEFQGEHTRRRISRMSRPELLLELLAHSAECRNPHRCQIHQMLEDRAKKLAE